MDIQQSPQSPRRATTAERRRQALERRKGGWTFERIGEELGISKQAAHNLVVGALKEIAEKTAESAEELRRLELERLDHMNAALWPAVIKGDVLAIDRALKIQARRAALLGLDAPAKTDVTTGGEPITKIIVEWQDDGSEDKTPPPP